MQLLPWRWRRLCSTSCQREGGRIGEDVAVEGVECSREVRGAEPQVEGRGAGRHRHLRLVELWHATWALAAESRRDMEMMQRVR